MYQKTVAPLYVIPKVMKKKLEADLISIAHRILKLKNRSELDQLFQETRNLYEKLSVLRFVEDNFSDVKPTIGYASAEAKLEEIYGTEEKPAEEQNKETDNAKPEVSQDQGRAEDKSAKVKEGQETFADENNKESDDVKQDKENEAGEGVKTDEGEGAPASEEEKEYTEEETDEQVKDSDSNKEPEQKQTETDNEKPEASDESQPQQEEQPASVKEDKRGENEESGEPDENTADKQPDAKPEGDADPGRKIEEYQPSAEEKQHTEEKKEEEDKAPLKEPEVKEEPAQQEQPKVEEPPKQQARPQFNFDFDSKEDSSKSEEITFENYKDYKEPEFVKKSEVKEPVNVQREWLPKEPEVAQKQEEKADSMWGNTQQQAAEPAQARVNEIPPLRSGEIITKVISLGLNDRIAFEKNLFNGSGEDLNRVVSQLNTMDRFADAKNFIDDLVKPDYNNWKGKEEYEERFMALVEQRFK